jgi:flagellin
MRINHNLMAMNANRYLSATGSKQSKSLEKISSGLRINTAADDAAGLAISEKMRAQISGLEQASDNALDGISLIQTAEGALQETHSILQRMRELAVQSSNDTNTQSERDEIQKEVDELAKEITRIANNTEFNSKKISNGGLTGGNIGEVKFHIGANTGQDISLSLSAMDAKTLGVSRDVTINASGAVIGNIDSATFTTDSYGAGIVDGAVIDVDYSETAAVQASVTAAANSDSTVNFTAPLDVAGSSIVVNVNGTNYTVADTDIAAHDGTGGDAALETIIGAADDGSGHALSSVASISTVGGKLTITANTAATGHDVTVTVNLAGADSASVTTAFGFGGGNTVVAGADAKDQKITLNDGTNTQSIDVTGTDTSLAITSGAFKGMTVNTAGGNTLSDIQDADNVTVTATDVVASAATFAAGELDEGAVTAAGVDVLSQPAASAAITTIEDAIIKVSAERSKLGAYQNRLEHTINNLNTTTENLQASESRIRDVDIASEMMNYTKLNILQQAAQSMLAQANQAPQGVLQLLR